MSLKAKIEAVIYASEEPITLLQLAGLLGLEAQRELDQLAVGQGRLDLETATVEEDSDAIEQEGASYGAEPLAAGEAGALAADEAGAETPADTNDLSRQRADERATRERERRLREYLRERVEALIAEYAPSDRGLEIREVAGGYRLATKPEYHDAVRGFVKSLKPPLRLTLQALETLAVVAYKQPVTSPEISEIRGVDSGGVLGSLLGRKLITTAGRKQVIGRPILYKTTKDFLLRFGLKDIAELPSIEEFEKLAGELAEQEEIPMSSEQDAQSAEERITHEDFTEQKDVTEPQADGDEEGLEVDGVDQSQNDATAVDGRLSGLPPRESMPGEDPSADEAAIQSGSEGL